MNGGAHVNDKNSKIVSKSANYIFHSRAHFFTAHKSFHYRVEKAHFSPLPSEKKEKFPAFTAQRKHDKTSGKKRQQMKSDGRRKKTSNSIEFVAALAAASTSAAKFEQQKSGAKRRRLKLKLISIYLPPFVFKSFQFLSFFSLFFWQQI